MKTPDVWDENHSSQRQDKRYLGRWKVALVFNSSANKPVYQTLTHDLSHTGTSVQYLTEEKINTALTLLLSPPPIDGVDQKIIRLKAEVKSCVPFRGGYRLGMSFIRDAESDKLPAILEMYAISDGQLASHPDADEFPTLNL
jgi:hypothetical protein